MLGSDTETQVRDFRGGAVLGDDQVFRMALEVGS